MKRTKKELIYDAIHHWILRNWGKAQKCDTTGCNFIPKRFEWALKKEREYSRNREDYFQFCPSCHRKYDWTPEQGRKVSIAMKKRIFTDEIRKNMSLGQLGRIIPKNVRIKMSQTQSERWKIRKSKGLKKFGQTFS